MEKDSLEDDPIQLLTQNVSTLSLEFGKSTMNLEIKEVKVIELTSQVNQKDSKIQGFVQELENKDSYIREKDELIAKQRKQKEKMIKKFTRKKALIEAKH